MSQHLHIKLLVSLAVLSTCSVVSCGGGQSGSSAGEPPPVTDTTPPYTQANPPAGLYPAPQFVTLESNEPATIYYTTDGSIPAPDGVTTFSGPSPRVVSVPNALSLKFFAVDAEGNQESLRSAAYTFDTNPPIVLLGGGLPTTLGFLEQGTVTFSVDELESSSVAWSAEVGGSATPGTGTVIASGTTAPSVLTQLQVPGWHAPIGGSTTLHLFVVDAAGGLGFQPITFSGLAGEVLAISGASGAMEITPGGEYLYIVRPQHGDLQKFGAQPGTADYHVLLETLPIAPAPSRIDITPDGSRVYVTCVQDIYEVDVATGAVVGPIATPGNVLPSGSDLAPDGSWLYFASDDGRVYSMDTDPSSPGYLSTFNSFSAREPLMTVGELDISDDGNRAVLAWSGGGQYGVYYIDTEPIAPEPLAYLVPATSQPINMSRVVISSDGARAWFGNETGKVARAALADGASLLETFNQGINAFGVTPSPDESVLMLTGGGMVGMRILDASTLELLSFVALGDGTGNGTSRDMALSPDGKRAYLVRNQGGPNPELQMLQLMPE